LGKHAVSYLKAIGLVLTVAAMGLYINLPFIGVMLVMVPLCINVTVLPTSPVGKLKRIDLIGSTTGFMIGISWGGVQYPWLYWYTVIPYRH
jgi:hypothetical protein